MRSARSGIVGRIAWSGLVILLVVGIVWACTPRSDSPSPDPTPTAAVPVPSPTEALAPTQEAAQTIAPTQAPEASPLPMATSSPAPTAIPEPIATPTPTHTATPTPTPSPTPTPTPIPTPIPTSTPPCTPQAFSITDTTTLDELIRLWESYPWAYCELVQLEWIAEMEGEPSQYESAVLSALDQLSVDDATALKIVKLPLLETIEFGDIDVMRFLAELSHLDPEGLAQLLSHNSITSGNINTPITLLYFELEHPAEAARLAALEWVTDGLQSSETSILIRLQELAGVSKRVFNRLLDRNLPWTSTHVSALRYISGMSSFAEDAVLKVIEMPFVDTMELSDQEALRRLHLLAENDPQGLQRVLSHPSLSDGITDELSIYVSILYLEHVNPELAAAINGLSWVKDGITYVPPRNGRSINADPEEFESQNVRNMVELGVRSPEFLLQLTTKPWVIDGISNEERGALSPFNNLTGDNPQIAVELLHMPFMDTVTRRDIDTLWKLAHLTWNSGVPLKEFLSSPVLARGITDNNQAIVDLLEVKAREPEEYDAIQSLTWIQDGVSVSEDYPVEVLTELATQTDSVFWEVMEKPWVRDGLTGREAYGVSRFFALAGETYGRPHVESALRIIDMPFLDTFESVDAAALAELALLGSEGDGSYLRQVLNHPSLSEGIMDRDTLIISVLHRVVRSSPETVNILLDPSQVYREERTIQLPLGGETDLAVIRIAPGTFRTIDILEEIVRQQEEFTKVAFPTGLVAIVNIEINTGGGPSGIITLRTGNEENFELIAHETAHTYWSFYPPWIREGAAELMGKIVIDQLGQAPASPSDTGCSLANTLGELDRLTYGQSVDAQALWWSGCSYTMGLGLYADLYNSLGDEEFRRGFGGLYLKMRNEEHNDECFGVERGLCYARKGFVEDASPGFADTAGGVIDRWYYGESQ